MSLGLLLIGVGMTLALLDAIPRQYLDAFLAWRIALTAIVVTVGYLYYRLRLAEPMSHAVLLMGVLWMLYALLVTFWI